MAPLQWVISTVLTYFFSHLVLSAGECTVPLHFQGEWYGIEQGQEITTLMNLNELRQTPDIFIGTCFALQIRNRTFDIIEGKYDANIVFEDSRSRCYKCWQFTYRTPNVVQYKISTCAVRTNRAPTLAEVCNDILPQQEVFTWFRTKLETVNCKAQFEGVWHFTYEIDYGGGGVCDSPRSTIVACQEPGSPYVDNQVYNMEFGKCPEITSSMNKKIRFQCLGEWRDEQLNVWSAMADLGQEIYRDRFRCMLTREDQQRTDNKVRYTMSRWAECDTLRSPYEGDIRLILWPVVYGSQIVQPTCNLPRNFTGTWFTTGEFDSDVVINSTHIYFKTKLDEFFYRETYFSCQQAIGSRYMMSAVTVGRCEIDYVCFDFAPRHHNIIRWRMGKPYRMTFYSSSLGGSSDVNVPDYLIRKFRQACMWYSFTIDRLEADWKYNTFLLNPPSPVDCPIAGRYKFTQIGSDSEKYKTRVEGITVRPRHQIDCRIYTSEFKSCAENQKKIQVDVEYCDTVDHTGRPIGEYDIPDHELACVGFWMEDMKSYMITYDELDAISRYRCWVYERLDWRDIIMSRSTRAQCHRLQTARSYTPEQGASLAMVLKESERIFDSCPMRFNLGENPYFDEELMIWVLGGTATVYSSVALTFLSLLLMLA